MDKAFDKTHTAILVLENQLISYMNPAAQRLIGWDIQELNKNINNLGVLSGSLANLAKLFGEIFQSKYESDLLSANTFKRFELNLEAQYFNLYLSKPSQEEYLLELSPIIYQDMNQVTHEFKRPIQNIKTLTEALILGAKNDPQKCDEYLQKLNQEADRLGTLVADMLSLSHIANGIVDIKRISIPLKATFDKVFDGLQNRALEKNIQLENNIADSVTIQADPKLFEHLVFNLVDNAIKYNKANGLVSISADDESITIKDTGLGISEEDQSKIFEQFYRIKDRVHIQGNGLGLNIVKAILELHDWQIRVESKLGEGSEFIISYN